MWQWLVLYWIVAGWATFFLVYTRGFTPEERKASNLGNLFLGLLICMGIGGISLPYLGWRKFKGLPLN